MGVSIPDMVLLLGGVVLLAGIAALVAGPRGGRFRGLPGWAAYWFLFAAVLISLSRAPRWFSFPLLAVLMFACLKAYFFVAPVRPSDRFAILAAYLAIPFALYPAFRGADELFLALVPVALFFTLPVLLSLGTTHAGLLDSMGRILLGTVFFVYCMAYLGLMTHQHVGNLELFGAMVLSTELPQRLAGRFRPGRGLFRPLLGFTLGAGTAMSLGWLAGPMCGLSPRHGALAGLLVAMAVTAGAIVTDAVAEDLELGTSSAWFGRGAFIDRTAPAVYAAPVFYHFLNVIS